MTVGPELFVKSAKDTRLVMLSPQQNGGHGSAIIWSCFWARGFGPLVIVDGPENQDVYIDILAKNFHSWLKKLVEDFIFQEDGTSCHSGGKRPGFKPN
ncbi:hypothetical protein RMCBS344292_13252 [Rhizopus microsporus]|nr:hypothetical protein RMCBS344292_13252 [Rhizopus microsporus]